MPGKLIPNESNSELNRRRMGQAIMAAGVGTLWSLESRGAVLAADLNQAPLNRFPRMMQRFLVREVRKAHRRNVQTKQALESREDAQRYVEKVRQKILSSLGPLPTRTPLKPEITGRLDRDGYRVEKIIFESRPNFPVTANLYLPQTSRKVPGVIGTCGHSANGKAAKAYQSFAQGLARQGYACLIYDPIGQGERLQYPNDDHKSRIGVGVREHIQAGNQQFLVGENLSMWRAWDGMRALDYLISRPEIDRRHLGVTGNSGGGTMTTLLCGIERRWTMAAPSCFVTTFLHNAENELPADTEQCPPEALALGLEHEDFLVALAPRPIVILAKEKDYFDVRGSEAAFRRLKKLYRLLDHPRNISLFVGPTEHGYSIENREAMYRCFNRVTAVSDLQSEPELTIEKDAALYCTESGQVAEREPATVASFTAAKARQLAKEREQLDADSLRQAVRDVLRLPDDLPGSPPKYRILRPVGPRGYPLPHFTTYPLETESGVLAHVYMLTKQRHYSRPAPGDGPALLYVAHRSSDQELRESNWLREKIETAATPTFTCDVRGIGESLPNTCGTNTFDNPYGCDYFYAIHGIMLDRPYLGQKVWDVLRTLQWLQARGYNEIDLLGSGWGALIATFAALLSETVNSVELQNRIASFESLAVDEDYDMPLAYLPPGVLTKFDLPDVDEYFKRASILH